MHRPQIAVRQRPLSCVRLSGSSCWGARGRPQRYRPPSTQSADRAPKPKTCPLASEAAANPTPSPRSRGGHPRTRTPGPQRIRTQRLCRWTASRPRRAARYPPQSSRPRGSPTPLSRRGIACHDERGKVGRFESSGRGGVGWPTTSWESFKSLMDPPRLFPPSEYAPPRGSLTRWQCAHLDLPELPRLRTTPERSADWAPYA